MDFIKKNLNHLNDSHKNYKDHLYGAIKNGFLLISAGLISIIHGLLPFLFTSYAAKTVIDIYYNELHSHKNKNYKKYIEDKKINLN